VTLVVGWGDPAPLNKLTLIIGRGVRMTVIAIDGVAGIERNPQFPR